MILSAGAFYTLLDLTLTHVSGTVLLLAVDQAAQGVVVEGVEGVGLSLGSLYILANYRDNL